MLRFSCRIVTPQVPLIGKAYIVYADIDLISQFHHTPGLELRPAMRTLLGGLVPEAANNTFNARERIATYILKVRDLP